MPTSARRGKSEFGGQPGCGAGSTKAECIAGGTYCMCVCIMTVKWCNSDNFVRYDRRSVIINFYKSCSHVQLVPHV